MPMNPPGQEGPDAAIGGISCSSIVGRKDGEGKEEEAGGGHEPRQRPRIREMMMPSGPMPHPRVRTVLRLPAGGKQWDRVSPWHSLYLHSILPFRILP